MKWLTKASLPLALALTMGVTTMATTQPAEAATPVLGPVFNDTDQWAISKNIAAMIRRTPKGATIRIAQYRISGDDPNVIPALRSAVNRGVRVKIVLDRSDRNPNPFGDAGLDGLRDLIASKSGNGNGSNPSKPSFILLCSEGCIGDGYNHNKFYLFSTMNSRKRVLVQSTANVAADNATAWNASIGIAGRTKLYNSYKAYFDHLVSRRTNLDYYRTTTDGAYKAYFFPRKSSTGDVDDTSTDTIWRILDEQVSCTGNTTGGTSTNHRTIIRIAVWGFTREKIAQKLRALANRDCWIDVAINNSADVSAEVKRALANHPRINVDNAMSAGRWMHAKYLLVEGNYSGRPNSKVAFVGSHNFTVNALRHNDETWLKIASASVHDKFRANFRRIMAASPDFPF
jgi:PLD-like domain